MRSCYESKDPASPQTLLGQPPRLSGRAKLDVPRDSWPRDSEDVVREDIAHSTVEERRFSAALNVGE